MPRHNLQSLFSQHLGNHRRTGQVLPFPGLSIDNIGSTPQEVAGGVLGQIGATGAGGVDSQVSNLSKQLNDLRATQQTQLDKLNENTQALQQNTSSKSNSSNSTGGGLSGLASSLFGGVLGIAPIVKGIFDLFGGSDKPATQPLVPFNLPASIQYEGALNSAGSVSTVDYGQGGQARKLGTPVAAKTAQTPPTVNIQVNAMDTQSFLDRSDDIARAVRQALLNSSSLSDVIADL